MDSRALSAGPGRDAPAARRLGRLAAPAVFAALAAALAAALGGFAIDDVFITYRYAASLAAGDGLVFDPAERVFGTTSPGTAVLLGLLARATGAAVPRLGAATTAAALAAIAWLLFASAARRGRAAEGFAAGLLVVGSPLAWVHVGNEMPLALALAMGAAALARAAGDGEERGEDGRWEAGEGSGSIPHGGGRAAGGSAGDGAGPLWPPRSRRQLVHGVAAGVLAGAAAAVRPEALAGIAIVAVLGWSRSARRAARRSRSARRLGSRTSQPAAGAAGRRLAWGGGSWASRRGPTAVADSAAVAIAVDRPAQGILAGDDRHPAARQAAAAAIGSPRAGAAVEAVASRPMPSLLSFLPSPVRPAGERPPRLSAGGPAPALLVFLAAAGAVVAAAALALAAWFGSPLPETFAVKRLHAAWMPATWASGLAFWPAAGRALSSYLTPPGLAALAALGVPGLALLVRRGGAAERLLALFALVLFVAYPFLGVPMYAWYATVPCLALAAGAAHAAGAVARAVAGGRRIAATALAVALVAAVGGPPAARLAAFVSGEVAPVRYRLYRAVGEWLRGHTAPGERVAALEVGTIGFFAERPIHDLLGLVSRASRPALARGDLPAAFLAGEPDLFVALPANPLSAAVERAPWFPGAFREVARLRHRPAGFEAVVYRRRPVPAPSPAASPVADRR